MDLQFSRYLENGNSPNTVLSSAVSIIGPGKVKKALATSRLILETFKESSIENATDDFDVKSLVAGLSDDDKSAMTACKRDRSLRLSLSLLWTIDPDPPARGSRASARGTAIARGCGAAQRSPRGQGLARSAPRANRRISVR